MEKCTTTKNYYNQVHYKFSKIQTSKKIISTPELKDDIRRVNQFQKFCKNKDLLDFGCGWGFFLKKINKAKSLNGVELGRQYFKKIKSYKKKNKHRNKYK